MTTPQVTALFDALEARGRRGCARFVGGCVRNTLLGAPIGDIDIATTLTPDLVTVALKAAGIRAVPTGIDHGTITAVIDGLPFEVTTLRRDVSTDGRRAVVAFTQDWALDAQRRDFTLNAVYSDREGVLFDPTGRGIPDGRAGAIIFVGEARTRIEEDSLRILRFFRFLAWYGRGDPDAEALEACRALADAIRNLPAERTSKELLKLLAADDPRMAVDLMARTGVLDIILPDHRDLADFSALVCLAVEGRIQSDPVLRLAALLPQDREAVRRTADTMRLSNAERGRLVAAAEASLDLRPDMSPKLARQALYQMGASTFVDRVTLAWAASGSTTSRAAWADLLELASAWVPPVLPVNGDDAAAAGLPRGPLIGKALAEVEAWWLDRDFTDGRAEVLEKLGVVAASLGGAP
ncbi:MAG: CCA tRNA nucleotidyltransferase [Alphaproteobacteria bacterium PA2]|nr:MAG: CCA tRNA nucleotidyltransferase [Alphaproteobacteria bacterium PA2]